MIPAPLLDNLLPWMIQISLVSLLGTALPLMFGIRHPRTQLLYGYLVLALCLLLPFMQPRVERTRPIAAVSTQSASVASTESAPADTRRAEPAAPSRASSTSSNAAAEPGSTVSSLNDVRPHFAWPWRAALLWVLVAGALIRLARLAIGAWQIRRFRLAAAPLYPVPETVTGAEALVRARAVVCLSHDVSSPATLGLFRPVVLMPASFLALDDNAQQAIACHELLHVRRLDWAVALVEGVISALFWFCPVAWLISEIRLAREQLVDGEVVRLTAEKDSYIQALLRIARARPTLDIVPAPMFIRRRHLTHRVRNLLDGASCSLRRLSLCYASTAILLALAGAGAIALFPLVDVPQTVEAASRPVPTAVAVVGAAAIAPAEPVRTPAIVVRREHASTADVRARPAPVAAAPVPNAGNEPLTGAIRVATTPDERASALALLERGIQNSDLHIAGTPPFHLDASFEAFGDVSDVGSGVLSETWLSGQRWRWTANLGRYSQVRVGSGNVGFDVTPVSFVPVRVQMLRALIFWPVRERKQMRIRVGSGQVDGAAVTCLLFAPQNQDALPQRAWNEEEYCIDGAGRLRVYSPVPGSFTRFGYASGTRFGGRLLPDHITTVLGGNEILSVQLTIRDAGTPDDSLFGYTPEMVANGTGVSMVSPVPLRLQAPPDRLTDDGPIVVVHVSVDATGRVIDAELVDPTSSLGREALEIVRAHRFVAGTQREGYAGVDFGVRVAP